MGEKLPTERAPRGLTLALAASLFASPIGLPSFEAAAQRQEQTETGPRENAARREAMEYVRAVLTDPSIPVDDRQGPSSDEFNEYGGVTFRVATGSGTYLYIVSAFYNKDADQPEVSIQRCDADREMRTGHGRCVGAPGFVAVRDVGIDGTPEIGSLRITNGNGRQEITFFNDDDPSRWDAEAWQEMEDAMVRQIRHYVEESRHPAA